MERAYDPTASFNKDNIVMKLASRDWSSLLSAETGRKAAHTQNLMDRIARAITGASPTGENTGYTGDLLGWPALYAWEAAASRWDDRNDENTSYTHGQPRGLWTRTPTSDTADDLPKARFGVGWRHAYISPPAKTGSENLLLDAWGKPIHCFRDGERFMILSAGPDGVYDFGDSEDPAAAVSIGAYDPTDEGNADNLALVIEKSAWEPGFLRLSKLTVVNAGAAPATLRCRLFGVFNSSGERADPVWTAGTDGVWADTDGDTALDDWVLGQDGGGSQVFRYDDTTTDMIVPGARYLVCWVDADGDQAPDAGEYGVVKIFQAPARPGGVTDQITIDAAADFTALP